MNLRPSRRLLAGVLLVLLALLAGCTPGRPGRASSPTTVPPTTTRRAATPPRGRQDRRPRRRCGPPSPCRGSLANAGSRPSGHATGRALDPA
jgi:hypothetical protein